MKNSNDIVYNRRKQIYDILRADGEVHINMVSKSFGVSPLTIRRDLDHFEERGLIERFYGGARLVRKGPGDNIFSSPLEINKDAIAQRAAALVEDGDIIFINTSSTALLMIDYIQARQVTIITNNGKALMRNIRDNLIVVLTGGEIRIPKESMVGDFAINNLNMVTATKSFLGVSGLSVQAGVTTAILQEVAINKLMLARVRGKRTVLADFTKIGQSDKFISGDISTVDRLVTDTQADRHVLDEFREHGVEVIQVDPFQRV
jgi:DeoR/GlpR family transcriptional regulator of sugar metabolism